MARKKKSMIGFDPLAWLVDDDSENKQTSVDESDEVVAESKKDKITIEKNIEVLGQSLDVLALLKGYELIQETMQEVVEDFYRELFSQHPDVLPLFDNTDESSRANKLISAIKLLFDNLENPDALQHALHDLGERHQAYGAEAAHYDVVATLLINSCQKNVGSAWTNKVTEAWQKLFTGVAEVMLAAYKEVDQDDVMNIGAPVETHADILVLQSVQDISKSDALKQEMLALIKENKSIKIDASDVSRVDGSALQLICGLFEYANSNDIELSWINPSDALLASADYLGVKKMLNLN